MPGWEDESLGAFGSASQIPDNTWFPVDTTTGQWGSAAPTLASDAGVNWAGIPDLIPTRTMAPSPMMGAGPPSPLSIGQVAGGQSPALGPGARLTLDQRIANMGGAPAAAPTGWAGVLHGAISGLAQASPEGRAILEYGQREKQQQLQNRLTMRRQALQEEQNDRAQVRERFTSFANLGQIKNKALRNLYADRLVKEMQESGEQFPADFLETFKQSSLKEGEQMTKFLMPLLQDLGMDPADVAELAQDGNFDKLRPFLELAQKVKKDKTEQARLAALDKIGAGDTLGDVSGVTAPATPGAPPGAPATGTRQALAAPSKDISDAIDESNTLYPQVRKELITSIAASESNFDPQATSPKGAKGVMQLMPGTAKEMGVDDPTNVKQNVRGGTRYFAQLLSKYKGNEAMALAAYNWGPGNVDEVKGDLSKMPESVQTYVKTTLQRASAGGGAPTGTTTAGQPTAPTGGTPQEQAQLTALDTRIAVMDKQIRDYTRIGGEEGRGRATATERQRDNLAQERDRLRTRMLEPTRAAERLEASKQTGAAAAERQLEAKMNEPIGPETAIKMDLPAETKWKDVPKGTRVLDRPGEGVAKELGAFKASHEGITRVIGMLDNPKAVSIVGTLLSSEDNAAFRRAAGAWISSVTPAERKFAAALVAEIAGIRNTISGQAVSAQEAEFLKPMLPSVADPDVATVRAKLEVLQEWIARKHEGARGQLDEMGFRTPKALPQPAASPPPPSSDEDLLKKHTK